MRYFTKAISSGSDGTDDDADFARNNKSVDSGARISVFLIFFMKDNTNKKRSLVINCSVYDKLLMYCFDR